MNTLLWFDQRTLIPNGQLPVLQPGQNLIQRVVHDKSTVYANQHKPSSGQMKTCSFSTRKSLGQAIMVSDFIVEGEEYCKDKQAEAHVLLETNNEGCFNNSKFF